MNNKKCPACGCEMKRNGRTGPARSAGAAVRAGRARPTPTTPPPGTSDPSSDGCCRRKPSSICRVRAGPSGARRRGSGGSGPCPRSSTRFIAWCSSTASGSPATWSFSSHARRLHVLSWHLARAETASAWRSLLSRIAPPDMVVTDGGSGFASAAAKEWPATKVQRCTFRVLPGKEEDDQEAESAGGKGAVRACEGIAAYRDPPSSRLVGRKVHAMGASSGRTSSRRRRSSTDARSTRMGESARRGQG